MAFISPDHGWLNIAPENGCLGNKPFLSFSRFSVTFHGLCEKLLGCNSTAGISVGGRLRLGTGTWRIIPISKWLGSPSFISHEVRPFGRGPTTLSLGVKT